LNYEGIYKKNSKFPTHHLKNTDNEFTYKLVMQYIHKGENYNKIYSRTFITSYNKLGILII